MNHESAMDGAERGRGVGGAGLNHFIGCHQSAMTCKTSVNFFVGCEKFVICTGCEFLLLCKLNPVRLLCRS